MESGEFRRVRGVQENPGSLGESGEFRGVPKSLGSLGESWESRRSPGTLVRVPGLLPDSESRDSESREPSEARESLRVLGTPTESSGVPRVQRTLMHCLVIPEECGEPDRA